TVEILSDGTAIDSVKYSSQEAYPERPKTIYIFAKDPTAKEILTIAPSSDTETKTTINLWWLKNSAPLGVLPGSISFEDKKAQIIPISVEEEKIQTSFFRDKIYSINWYNFTTGQVENVSIANLTDGRYEYAYIWDITNSQSQELLYQEIRLPDGRLIVANYKYAKLQMAKGEFGTLVGGTETVYYNFSVPYSQPLVAVHDSSTVTKENFLIEFEPTLTGRQKTVTYFDEKEPFSSTIKHRQRAVYIDGKLTPEEGKKRVDIGEDWKREMIGSLIYGVIFIGGIAGVTLLAGLIGWLCRKLEKRKSEKNNKKNNNKNSNNKKKNSNKKNDDRRKNNPDSKKGDSGDNSNKLFEFKLEEPLIRSFGFDENEEKLADFLVAVSVGESKNNTNHEVSSKIFDEFRWWLKNVMEIENAESIKFTREDLRLFYRIYVVAANARQTMPAFTSFLFYVARNMAGKGRYTEIGKAIKMERYRIYQVLKNGARGWEGLGRNKPLSTYINYDDIDDLFRTPKYVRAYLAYYWNYWKGGNNDWSPAPTLRKGDKFPEHLLPYKTYIEVSGKRFSLAGWIQSIINVFPVYVFNGLMFCGVLTIAALTTGMMFSTVGKWILGIAWVSFIIAGGIFKGIEWRWQSQIRKLKKIYGKPIPPYQDIKMPSQGKRLWANRLLWFTITIIKGIWNWYVFSYLINATLQIGWFDPVLFPSSFGAFFVTPIKIILFVLTYFWLQPVMEKYFKKFGRIGRYLLPIGIIFAAFYAWWWIGVNWGVVFGGIPTLLILWIPFLIFFFLDTYSIFYLLEGIIGFGKGIHIGLWIRRGWKRIEKEMVDETEEGKKKIREEFLDKFAYKIIPENVELNPQQKEIAFAEFWNLIIEVMYYEDILTEEEKGKYSFKIEGKENSDFLSGRIEKYPDFREPPKNKWAEWRLVSLCNQLMMETPRAPPFEEIMFSVITPAYNEGVLYFLNDSAPLAPALNQKFTKGLHTFLTYLIERYPDEWQNLIKRLEKRIDFLGREREDIREEDIEKDLRAMANLRRGEKLFLSNDWIQEEVEMWASCRFQPLGRTVRGIMHYEKVLKLIAKINYHDKSKTEEEIEEEVAKRFQYMVSYQDYDNILNKNPDDARIKAVKRLMKYYPNLEIAYLGTKQENGKEVYYSILTKGIDEEGNPIEIERIRLPGPAILAQGKPENQNHMLTFVRHRYAQLMDINQDMYIEDCFFMPLLLQEFKKNPDIVLVGFPEEIFTESYGAIASFHAHADRTFVTVVQRVLNTLGIRFHYGHPDVYDMDFVRSRGGVS
ncbi:MAG: hypothetical protein DRP72_02620, partial [Candidatus Omnitrophota bacterium]